jgi:hypothetical protein
MADTYYRLHRADAPAFTADNAWSGLWGSTFSPDGSRTECGECDGAGVDDHGQPCEAGCDNGWWDCYAGYSCCDTAEELLDYFTQHNPADDNDPVVIFEGEQVGTGFDAEPLVIPTTTIRWTTIGQLRKEIA